LALLDLDLDAYRYIFKVLDPDMSGTDSRRRRGIEILRRRGADSRRRRGI